MSEDTRSHEFEMGFEATPEEIWRALTEPEQIVKWFAVDAEVEPREGGRHYVSWGEGVDAEHEITIWDAPRHLRVVGRMDAEAPSSATLVEDYTIEVRGDRTVLRLVHSGIPTDPSWDGFYDGTASGWPIALHFMRYVVEHHLDHKAATDRLSGPIDMLPGQGWARVLGPELLNAADVLAGAKTGDAYSFTTADGDRWEGEVVYLRAPEGERDTCALILSITPLGDALFSVGLELMGQRTYVGGGLQVYGPDADRDTGARYTERLRKVLALAG